MASLVQRIEPFITDLLHINAGTKNKLIDLEAGDPAKTYYLSRSDRDSISRYILNVIADRIGKPGNTALLRSSMEPDREQRVGADVNAVEWKNGEGGQDSRQLHKYVEAVYKELSLKGNNPLFLSVGALEWEVAVRGDVIKRVRTPFLLFPVRLVRTGSVNTPIYLEFIDDEIYINPCLIAKLKQALGASGEDTVQKLPHPNGEGVSADIPVEVSRLGNGEAYFAALTAYIAARRQSENTVFTFDKEVVAIAQYNHDELCMYYDIKRHRDKLYASILTDRIFNQHEAFLPSPATASDPMYILDRDSVQERMIRRVVNGESLVIKGPPGSGKTLTITNMLAALLAANKRVLLSSQKPAAMMEVVAKLPEPLRKFVMVLDSETEAQAAALNPNEVRKDFNALLHKASAFQRNAALLDDLMSGTQAAKTAARSLERYLTLMFGPMDIIGNTYYEALDILCKIEAEPILFAKPGEVTPITRPVYNELLAAVTEAGSHFEKLSDGHPIVKSPWRPNYGSLTGVNIDAALSAYAEISVRAKRLIDVYATLSDGLGARAGELPLSLMRSLLHTTLTAEQLAEAAAPAAQQAGKDTAEAYHAYREAAAALRDTVAVLPEKRGELRRFAAKTQKWIPALSVELFFALCEEWEFVSSLAAPARLPYLLRFLEAVEKLEATVASLEDKLYTLVQKELCKEDVLSLLREAYKPLSEYAATDKSAPRLLDFKAKKYYQQMSGLGYGDTLPFADAVAAVCLLHEIDEARGLIAREQAAFSAQIHVKITDEQVALLDRLIAAVREGELGIAEYVSEIASFKEDVTAACALVSCKAGATLGDVAGLVQVTVAFDTLRSCFALLLTAAPTFAYQDEEGLLSAAEALSHARQLLSGGWLGTEPMDIGDRVAYLSQHGQMLEPLIDLLADSLSDFAAAHFKSYYTSSPYVSVNDLAILVSEGTDRSIVQAANAYLTILYRENALSLERFFRPFESGVRSLDGASFADHFEHSVFFLAVEARLALLGGMRYGLGDHVTGELIKREAAERSLAATALSLVEQQCISRINPKDPDFAFLSAERSGSETIRRFFKQHAEEILKLKQCFILSPSTVSVFMRDPKFAEFDVVIVDEASQLTPTAVLPMLFRTKQIVLVGDEWQMPPIKHFVARGQRAALGADGETLYLNPDMSVLSLALNNCAFPAEKLECHYRSRTEPLITFSQGRYYPYMRTFPSTTPKREGLGFKDIYLPDGFCESARNEAEAAAVVAELNLHFDTYYKDGRLSESVGVVAFGEEQVECIRAAVAADKALTKKIRTAIENFPDLEEKLIFFKTIETVQGQETDHLILSLTYGRSASGRILQSFGELNVGQASDRLGECIFNVAVTRAKVSVTMIHSVRAEDITNENISFLSDYLYTVRRFSEGGRSQFVGKTVEETPRGFLRQVADTLVSFGVDADRIVVGFGATQGSVRIPIAILSEDKTRALLGVWCETEPEGDVDYYDYNMRYFRVLEGENRDWKLHRVYIQDWVDNRKATKEALCEAVKKYVLTNQ